VRIAVPPSLPGVTAQPLNFGHAAPDLLNNLVIFLPAAPG